MKYTILFGSPRKPSNTMTLLEPYLDELKKLGHTYEIFDLYDMNIGPCMACLGCQKDKTRAYCVQNDDMQPILDSVSTSDAIVCASPIHGWYCTAPVKNALDRLIYPTCKYYGDDPHGPMLLKGKKFYIITTCGYPIEKGADVFEEGMKRLCKHVGLTYSGMLAERQRNLKEAFMDAEKEAHAREFARKE